MANTENLATGEESKKLLSVEGGGEVLAKGAVSAVVGFVAGSVLAIAIPALPSAIALAVTIGLAVGAVVGAYYKIKALCKELKANAAKPPEQQDTRAYIYGKFIAQIVGVLVGGGAGYEVNIISEVSSGVTAALDNAQQGVTVAAATIVATGAKAIGVEGAAAKVSNLLPNTATEPGGIIQASVSTEGSGGTQVASADDAGPGSEDEEPRMSEGERQAIAEARQELPEHAKYVDERGKFDTRACAKGLWETGEYERPPEAVTKARQMETEWIKMVSNKASKIV